MFAGAVCILPTYLWGHRRRLHGRGRCALARGVVLRVEQRGHGNDPHVQVITFPFLASPSISLAPCIICLMRELCRKWRFWRRRRIGGSCAAVSTKCDAIQKGKYSLAGMMECMPRYVGECALACNTSRLLPCFSVVSPS